MKIKEILPYIIIIFVVVIIRTFIVTPIKVNGTSMEPTLLDKEVMLLTKYNKNDINRYDIVVIDIGDEKIIKRVMGLPKEDISYDEEGLKINGKVIEDGYANGSTENFKDYCAADEYFVLGDNREVSYDSRKLGCINKENILGKTNFIVFPFSKWGKLK